MKSICLILFLAFPLYLSAQYTIPYKDLKDVSGVMYYQNIKFTGITSIERNNKNVFLTYLNGLLNCTVIQKNTIIKYNNGIISQYTYRTENKNEIVNIDNSDLSKSIVSIQIGIKCENQVGNTVFYSNNELFKNDSTQFYIGVYICYKEKKECDFIKIENIKFNSAIISADANGFAYRHKVLSSYISNRHLIFARKLYLEDILYMTSNNEIVPIPSWSFLTKELEIKK